MKIDFGKLSAFCCGTGIIGAILFSPSFVSAQPVVAPVPPPAISEAELTAAEAEDTYIQGLNYLNGRYYDKAMECFNKAIELQGDVGAYYESRAMTEAIIAGRKHRQGADEVLQGEAAEYYRKAVKDYTAAIELSPENMNNYQARGIIYTLLDKFNEALADFAKVIENQPEDYSIYDRRAVTYIDMGEYEKAMADLDKAKSLNKDDHHNVFLRGVWSARQGKYQEALAIFDKLTAENKWFADAWLEKALVHEDNNQPVDAYFAYREFLVRDREKNPVTHAFVNERIKSIMKIDLKKFREE